MREDPLFRIIDGDTRGLTDADAFLERIAAEPIFGAHEPIYVTRAPGRLDVMGGIADYSGSLVLEMPLKEATLAAVQLRTDRRLRIKSIGRSEFSMHLSELDPLAYEQARTFFAASWASYAAGAFLVLMREKECVFEQGASILIDSSVPEGKGVSSSAALEVAVMKALCSACLISVEPTELAFLCQKVEHLVAGAPCGIMDQITAVSGREEELLMLKCQPAEIVGHVPMPGDASLFGIDSGIRHHVSGTDYGSVRTGAFMGYRIVADLAGLEVHEEGGRVRIDDPLYRGYLANIPPWTFEEQYAPHLPEQMEGGAFLEKYSGITDPVTRVEPGRDYAVRTPTSHPVHEHFRVRTFAELLREVPSSPQNLERMGELMFQSHASYSACGLGSEATDRLVDLVRTMGPARGLYGAKITGGGSGGTVAVLGAEDALPAVEEAAGESHLFQGSSPAAETFGCLIMERDS